MKERIWLRVKPATAKAITARVDDILGLPDAATGIQTACRVYSIPESADVMVVLDAKHRSKLTAPQRSAEVRVDNRHAAVAHLRTLTTVGLGNLDDEAYFP